MPKRVSHECEVLMRKNSDNNSDNFVSYVSDWMLGKMTSALYLLLLAIGWNIDAAALSMISGSGKMDN